MKDGCSNSLKAFGELILFLDRDYHRLSGIPKCWYVVGRSWLSYMMPTAYCTLIGNALLLLKLTSSLVDIYIQHNFFIQAYAFNFLSFLFSYTYPILGAALMLMSVMIEY